MKKLALKIHLYTELKREKFDWELAFGSEKIQEKIFTACGIKITS